MSYKDIFTRLQRYKRRLNGCTIVYDCTAYRETVEKITALGPGFRGASDRDLAAVSQRLAASAKADVPLDELVVEAFALVKEAARRVLKIEAFDEQIIGGIVLHRGAIAEMQTGEGKTLTAVFPAFLNALGGKGVHVITFNDYLARRDAEWMGPVYDFLGLTARFVQEGMGVKDRQRAYNADITYVTAQSAGFDFLRDNLSHDGAQCVHRDFHYAIIDEADSILIDEARVPLVIAGILDAAGAEGAVDGEHRRAFLARFVKTLQENDEYEFDEYARNIFLTERGLERVENALQCGNLYASSNGEILRQVNSALHAEYLLCRDIDYLVRDNGVELVDDFTGRVAERRRWPDGLHSAIEAKEQCPAQKSGVVLNSITLQHFLRRYPKRCGMTATAQIAEEEFRAFYSLPIVVVPSHRKCVRIDHPDSVFRTKKEKNDALVREIVAVHATGRPILVGTQSVRESMQLAGILTDQGVSCQVLNAKQDQFEAAIIAEAGKPGAVTISTNMAGRGTDIRLGGADEKQSSRVIALGGLYVIGTNRNESLRIDSQLRGRAGRQGNPGSSRFFVSLEDDLYCKYRLGELLPSPIVAIDNAVVRSELNRIQRIIEGQHLEIKKTLCRYTNIVEQQREHLFSKRREILYGTAILDFYRISCADHYNELLKKIGWEALLLLCRRLALSHLDAAWSEYLAEIDLLREGIHLRAYGKQDPLFEFNKCATAIFENILLSSEDRELKAFAAIEVKNGLARVPGSALKTPSSTWTYLINDNPFDDAITGQLMGDTGFSLWAGLLWPLTIMHYLLRKKGKRNPEISP